MKKEEGNTNLLMLIIVPVLIGIVILIGYLMFSNNLEIEKNLSNGGNIKNDVSVTETIPRKPKIDGIDGIYRKDKENPRESYDSLPYYVFYMDGKVSYEGDESKKGTYTIENDTVVIKYNTESKPDTEEEKKADEKEELILINENAIKGYTKVYVRKNIIGKWTYHEVKDEENNTIPLSELFDNHTEKKYTGIVTFNDDGTYTNDPKAFSSEDDDTEGTYEVSGDQITLTTKKGKTRTLCYNNTGLISFKYDDYNMWLEKIDDKIWID